MGLLQQVELLQTTPQIPFGRQIPLVGNLLVGLTPLSPMQRSQLT
jgi:hypothetical protein